MTQCKREKKELAGFDLSLLLTQASDLNQLKKPPTKIEL
jgi:hypothetical protein|nr:MAG TPA: hypothetical protein [Caudoviricetes sp.]